MNKKKKGGKHLIVIKIDLEKAYDRLNWAFIRDTLIEMGLPTLMVETIMLCILTCSMRILWNGEPTNDFHPSRGICQGDPLSPYIFVACMERLSQLIDKQVQMGQWTAIKVCKGGPIISNLLFTDDLVLFAGASYGQARVIKGCVDNKFCRGSGQVNPTKSKILFLRNTMEHEMTQIRNILEIAPTKDLGKYLGVPTVTGQVTRVMFQHIIDRVENRLSG